MQAIICLKGRMSFITMRRGRMFSERSKADGEILKKISLGICQNTSFRVKKIQFLRRDGEPSLSAHPTYRPPQRSFLNPPCAPPPEFQPDVYAVGQADGVHLTYCTTIPVGNARASWPGSRDPPASLVRHRRLLASFIRL